MHQRHSTIHHARCAAATRAPENARRAIKVCRRNGVGCVRFGSEGAEQGRTALGASMSKNRVEVGKYVRECLSIDSVLTVVVKRSFEDCTNIKSSVQVHDARNYDF
jgi:hypothetical protein